MTPPLLIGIAVYILLGLFTAVRFLICRGKQMKNCWENTITEKHFDTDDELAAFGIIFIWPIVWLGVFAVGLITVIERCIVVPIVNKGIKKNGD